MEKERSVNSKVSVVLITVFYLVVIAFEIIVFGPRLALIGSIENNYPVNPVLYSIFAGILIATLFIPSVRYFIECLGASIMTSKIKVCIVTIVDILLIYSIIQLIRYAYPSAVAFVVILAGFIKLVVFVTMSLLLGAKRRKE